MLSHSDRVAGGGRSGSGQSSSQESKTEIRMTTVLFVEVSKGGTMQKKLRECIDRITPMLGFSGRVTDKGVTPLGSLLTNKNLV